MEKIITYFGADNKVGVTMITQSIADILARELRKRNMEEKVLLLQLSGKTGFEYTAKKGGSLDTIRAAVLSDLLSPEELMETCAQDENLFMLKGTSNLLERRTYEAGFAERLLQTAGKAFDYILIDAGSSPDLGLSIGSLIHSGRNILVTTQQPSALESFMLMEEQILSPLGVMFSALIINKFAYSGKMLETENSLSEKYGIEKSFCIPFSEYGWQAEVERKTILDCRCRPYTQGIRNLVNDIYPEAQDKHKTSLLGGVFRRQVYHERI